MLTERRWLPLARVVLAALPVLVAPGAGASAADDPPAREDRTAAASPPRATVLAAINDFDQFGMQGEYYVGRGRLSVFVGAGYLVPDREMEVLPKGAVFTGGGRIYTSGLTHRAFVELSYGPQARGLESQQDGTLDRFIIYGPNVLVGYQRVARRGLTFLAACGAGAERGVRFEHFELRVGVGHTWR